MPSLFDRRSLHGKLIEEARPAITTLVTGEGREETSPAQWAVLLYMLLAHAVRTVEARGLWPNDLAMDVDVAAFLLNLLTRQLEAYPGTLDELAVYAARLGHRRRSRKWYRDIARAARHHGTAPFWPVPFEIWMAEWGRPSRTTE